MSQYPKHKTFFETSIYQLNEVIKSKAKTTIKSSIKSRASNWSGERGYTVKFSGNFNGEIPQNSQVELYDPLGNKINDDKIVASYLNALTKKIKNEGLAKKDGLFSELFDNLVGCLNFIEDFSRISTKTFFNKLIVGLMTKAIDYCTGTKIYKNLEDKQYFSSSKETKGIAKIIDPSYIVSNLAFRPTRFALRVVEKVATGIFFSIKSRSHYFPTITQKDLDKNEKQREIEKAKEREIEKAKEKEKEEERERKGSKVKLKRAVGMRRPDITSDFIIKPTGMAPYDRRPKNDYFTSTAYSPDDLLIKYENPYIKNNPYNHNSLATTSLSQIGSSGPKNKLTLQQTEALFNEARLSWQRSFKKAESVTPPRNGVSFQRRFDPGSFRQSIKDQEGQEGQGR